MKAYKVFKPDWTCNGFQYEVGKTYIMKDEPILCQRGFHACEKVSDCFTYYSFDPKNKVAEVILSGIIVGEDGDKQASSEIKIVKELSWEDMLVLANSGIGNSGNRNSGYWNSGHFNSITPDTILVFNKPCKRIDWDNAKKPDFIFNININQWVDQDDLPTGGKLITKTYKEAWLDAFNSASKEDIKLLKTLPNWDADVFEEITGIKVG